MFDIVWHHYCEEIKKKTANEFNLVPIKDGKTPNGWFCAYGDGNEKIKRERCQFPLCLGKIEKNHQNTHYIDKNTFLCSNSPVQGNQYSQKYLCCLQHTHLLMTLGVKLCSINDYITYIQCIEIIQRTKSENVKQNMHKKISTFKIETIQLFDSITTQLVETLSNGGNTSNDNMSAFQKISIDEMLNDESIDELQACRKAENISKISNNTGGTIVIMNATGAILSVGEVPIRETPSFVIKYIYDAFTNDQTLKEFYERIEILGIHFIFSLIWHKKCD